MGFTEAARLDLAPGKHWTVQGDRIIWHGSRSGRPTLARINARVAELKAAQPLADLRAKRAGLLAASDWIVVRATETATDIPPEWKTYRQALRDLPAAFPAGSGAVWPDPPS